MVFTAASQVPIIMPTVVQTPVPILIREETRRKVIRGREQQPRAEVTQGQATVLLQ